MPKIFSYLFGLSNGVFYIVKKYEVMQGDIKSCPDCYSTKFVKHGFVNGFQRYLCKRCFYKFTVPKKGKSIKQDYVIKTLQLYLEGLSNRDIDRFMGVNHVTVKNWAAKYLNKIDQIEIIANGSYFEKVDKLCSYKGGKKTVYNSGIFLTGLGNGNLVIIKSKDAASAEITAGNKNTPPPEV